MPGQYCFVCASNEGVFLDVTPDNQNTFGDQVETCLSTKIDECTDLSNKICYKCAYELDQCAKFVQKYKKSHEISEAKAKTLMPCCFLCCELVDSDRIFDITKDDNVIFNPLRKIRSIFNDNFNKKDSDSKLICLTCRYNLDVLYDLKRVYQETIVNLKALINEEISYSNFPKVHTDVVNRKTTITTFPDITFYGSVNSSDTDSNEENMARNKRRSRGRKTRRNAPNKLQNNKSKIRNCDKCHNAVAKGIDMYRFYHTGLTVCKNCWLTIDPTNDRTRRFRQIQSNLETKLCTVFLTDVLSQEYNKKKIYEMEKNKDVNMSFDSSMEEIKSTASSPLSVSPKNHIVNGRRGRPPKRKQINQETSKSDVERTPLKMTRLNKERTDTNEMKSIKASVDAEQQPSTHLTTRQRRKRMSDDRSSDSDCPLDQREARKNNLSDRVNKTSKKKQKFDLERRTSNTRLDSSDETSNEDSVRSKVKDMTSSSMTSKKEEEKSGRTRSSSMSSTDMISTEFKNEKSPAQSEVKTEYVCDKCNKKFDTKLSNAKHRLTHLKQAALKLEKLNVSSVKEKQDMEVDSHDDKISKEETHFDRTISADKYTNDLSEEISNDPINIEDDTDEEICNLSTKEYVKKKVEKKISDEDGNVINKLDTAKSESCVEDESVNNENIETKESEQSSEKSEKLTIMSDETVTLEIEDKDREDEDTRDNYMLKDEDKTSANRDNDKDEDTQETIVAVVEHNMDENKDKETENDAKVSSIEEEKSISENKNDEVDLHEETQCDSEIIRSPILSIHNTTKDNKDYSESCKNNLENDCENNEYEIIKEPEIPQCDIMDEYSKKDTEDSEESIRKILPIDETETLSDDKNLDDTIIINEEKTEEFEKQQNRSDEKKMKIDIITEIDKPNSAKDTIKPDDGLSNGEKHDEIKDNDEDDIAISVNSDNNDDKSKKIMEETIPLDDSTEKRKLEEEIRKLEELVDDNAINNKHRKVQENSIYILDNSSADAANEILKEVFELAAAEVQQREEDSNVKNSDDVEIETLENISREIRKSADMPSLDPISVMEIDDDNDIMLN